MSGLNLFESIVAGQERAPPSGASIKGKAIKKTPSPEANIKEKNKNGPHHKKLACKKKKKKKRHLVYHHLHFYILTQ